MCRFTSVHKNHAELLLSRYVMLLFSIKNVPDDSTCSTLRIVISIVFVFSTVCLSFNSINQVS